MPVALMGLLSSSCIQRRKADHVCGMLCCLAHRRLWFAITLHSEVTQHCSAQCKATLRLISAGFSIALLFDFCACCCLAPTPHAGCCQSTCRTQYQAHVVPSLVLAAAASAAVTHVAVIAAAAAVLLLLLPLLLLLLPAPQLLHAGPVGMGVAMAVGLFDKLESVVMVPTHIWRPMLQTVLIVCCRRCCCCCRCCPQAQ
jgi:hypothetical protein